MKKAYSHLITGEELGSDDILGILDLAKGFKKDRKNGRFSKVLEGKHLALLFDKPSLRTRFSFTVAMAELGGHTIESINQTRKAEEPEDTARVLSGYCHGIVVRTFEDDSIRRMARTSTVPVINGLSDLHHPCQILADLFTLQETFDGLKGITISYMGDGNNILNSLLLLAPHVGVNIHFSCPIGFEPHVEVFKKAQGYAAEMGTEIKTFSSPIEAAKNSNALYTDVWASMGQEEYENSREKIFTDFQLNENILSHAAKNAVVMHCLPMKRGKEISDSLPDSQASVIFRQSENRLHVQKALLAKLLT